MTTKDYFPGIDLADDLQLLDDGSAIPDGEGILSYRDGEFTFVDGVGQFNPRQNSDHEDLRTLNHIIITSSHTWAITRSDGKIASILWSISSVAYRKFEVTSRSGGKISGYRLIQYDTDGETILRQLDYTVARSGGKVTGGTVTRTT